ELGARHHAGCGALLGEIALGRRAGRHGRQKGRHQLGVRHDLRPDHWHENRAAYQHHLHRDTQKSSPDPLAGGAGRKSSLFEHSSRSFRSVGTHVAPRRPKAHFGLIVSGISRGVRLLTSGSTSIEVDTASQKKFRRYDWSVQLPANVQRIIQEYADAAGFPALKRAAAAQSEAYRAARPLPLANGESVAAYLVTRMPATYAAANAVLREVRARIGRVESVLDAGAGTGGGGPAARDPFPA